MQSSVAIILLTALAALAGWNLKPEKEPDPQAPPVLSIQEIGSLNTLRVNYSNVIEFSERISTDIPWTQRELRFGSTNVLLIARGECLVGTDLKLAKYEHVAPEEKTATLFLKTPTVISARLNHDSKTGGSHFYTVSNKGLAALLPGTEGQTRAMNLALEKAQKDMDATCNKLEYVAAAKRSAEAVLQPTIGVTGWKIKLAWN